MTNATETLQRYFEAYNSHDAEAVIRIVSDQVSLIRPGQSATGREELLGVYQTDWADFPGCRIEVRSAVSEGRRVFAEATLLGTNTGSLHLPDGTVAPPTGRNVLLEWAAAGEVQDGVLTRLRVYWDNMDFMQQLGLVAG